MFLLISDLQRILQVALAFEIFRSAVRGLIANITIDAPAAEGVENGGHGCNTASQDWIPCIAHIHKVLQVGCRRGKLGSEYSPQRDAVKVLTLPSLRFGRAFCCRRSSPSTN